MRKVIIKENITIDKNIVEILKENLIEVNAMNIIFSKDGLYLFTDRGDGDLAGKGFYLNSEEVNWEIVRDNLGAMVLLPTRKW